MAGRSLFEIGQDVRAFYDLIEDSDGELMPETEPILDEFFMNLAEEQEQKLSSYRAVVKRLDMEAKFAKEEANMYRRKAEAREASITRLKARLLEYMQATGQTKAKTAEGLDIRVQANGGKLPLEIREDMTVPAEFLVQPPPVPNVDAIRQALEDGRELEFASLKDRGVHLRIA